MGTLRWRPSRLQAGKVTYGREVELRLPREDLAFLQGMWERTREHPTAPHVNELRTLLDLFAYFPGSRFQDAPVRRQEADYASRMLDEAHALADPAANSLGRLHKAPTDTELGAAVMSFPRTGSQRLRVLEAIAAAPDGLLDEEIATVPGIADTAHRTRRSELVQGGWVEDSGRTRRTASGADSIVWVLTPQGKAKWQTAA